MPEGIEEPIVPATPPTTLEELTPVIPVEVPIAGTPVEPPAAPEAPKAPETDQIAKARKEEKDKLYPKIKDLEKENTELKDLNKGLVADVARLKSELEEVKITMADSEKATEDLEALKVTLRQEMDEKLAKRDLEHKVDLHREKMLNENAGKLLPELVTGSTIEEIDQAVEKSKTRYGEIVTAIQTGTTPPPAPPLPPTPQPPAPGSPEIPAKETLRSMPMADYARDRAALHMQAAKDAFTGK